jgi:hypothetical protein
MTRPASANDRGRLLVRTSPSASADCRSVAGDGMTSPSGPKAASIAKSQRGIYNNNPSDDHFIPHNSKRGSTVAIG